LDAATLKELVEILESGSQFRAAFNGETRRRWDYKNHASPSTCEQYAISVQTITLAFLLVIAFHLTADCLSVTPRTAFGSG